MVIFGYVIVLCQFYIYLEFLVYIWLNYPQDYYLLILFLIFTILNVFNVGLILLWLYVGKNKKVYLCKNFKKTLLAYRQM